MFRLRDKGACFNDPGDSKPGFLSSFLPKAIKVCMYIHDRYGTERSIPSLASVFQNWPEILVVI